MSLLATPLCQTLGIEVPVVQAPIGSAATPELVAAVAGAGGLGMLALTWLTGAEAVDRVRRLRELTHRPFGVNFVLDFPITDTLAACLDEGAPVVSTFWGDPATVHGRIHAAGALHLHVVASVDEARRAVDAGVDAVVAQGWEAGGHVRGHVATMALVPAVVDAVGGVPVIAAGGIGDGRGLAAALALGAQAGWLGTRFLTAVEALTHDVHRRRVIAAAGQDAVFTQCFDDGWPDAPHRVIRNSTLSEWEAAGSPAAPRRPGENDVVATDTGGRTRLRYGFAMPLAGMAGDLEAMPLYAGQSAGLVRDVAPAAEIVRTIATQATQVAAEAWRPPAAARQPS
jgi:NAD(P)H-dependent flavin oxidoreductase YrpB (nitropropane dioxygenase family)